MESPVLLRRGLERISAGDLIGLQEWLEEEHPPKSDMNMLIDHAVEEEQENLFPILLKYGASPKHFVRILPKNPIDVVLKKGKGNVDILNLILSHVKAEDLSKYVNRKDRKKYTMLYTATKNGHTACVKKLLSSGAEVNKPSCYDRYTPLMAAAEKGHADILQMLLEAGAKVNRTTVLGDTALCWAAKSSQVECVRLLLCAGASVNLALKCGESALMAAVKSTNRDSLRVVMDLIEAGANVTCKDWRGQTALWYASNYGSEEVAKYIATKMHEAGKVDVDLSVLVAVERDHPTFLQRLLDYGWSVNCVDKYGRGLLHLAAERGIIRCLELLLNSEQGKSLNINAVAGSRCTELTPLHLAIRWCHPTSMQLLLTGGADTNFLDSERTSPLIACMALPELRSRATMVKRILRHGCDVDASVMAKVVQPWGLQAFDLEGLEFHSALAWSLRFQELWFAKMVWLAGAQPGEVASWTEATLPWPEQLLYPADEYTPAASKADIIHFIETTVHVPRTLQDLCRDKIRRCVPSPVHESIEKLPLPPHIIHMTLNLPELGLLEKESLAYDESFRQRFLQSDNEEYEMNSTTSESESDEDM